jgi:hypothetical protein
VDIDTAEETVSDLLAEGVIYRFGDDLYALSDSWALAEEIRQLGDETEDGILVPYDVLDEMQSGQAESED